MIEALAFQQTSPKLVAPPISEGLPNGLVLQLWIRRTGATTRQPIVELAGANSRIVLGSGDRPDVLSLSVIANGNTNEIRAPGALALPRWVQVRAIVAPDGTAQLDVLGMKLAQGKLAAPGSEARTLMIGGLVGELAQLQVWKHYAPTKLSYDPPVLNLPNLWAFYPLAKLEWDAASQRMLAKDAGPNQRHAALQDPTSSPAPVRVVHDEPLDRGQAAHLRFLSNDQPLRLSPLTGSSGKLTLEAWVCPVGDLPMPVVQLQGSDSRLALVVGGKDGELALLSISNNQSTVLARVTTVARANQWSHVAVTLEVVKSGLLGVSVSSSLQVGLFAQGQLRQHKSLEAITNVSVLNAAALIKKALLPDVRVGGQAPGNYPRFRGGMAELRIWRGVAQERVESLWLARARGDEAELIACYRLDTDPSGTLVDISPRRGLAHAPSGISLQREQCPPLPATSGELAFRVQARGKLLREWLPGSNVAGIEGASSKINLQLTNTTTGETTTPSAIRTQRRVFDATIEVSSRSGNSPLGRVLEVRLDQPLTLLQRDGNQLVATTWAANQSHAIPLPASGRVRLRFAAMQLACPTIRVRVSGTPGGVWTIVRPDEAAQRRLRQVTAQSLQSPPDGRRSPLPAGTSDADAQALADSIARIGTQLVRGKSITSLASAKFLGEVGDLLDDGAEFVEDTYNDGVDVMVSGGEAILATGQDALAGATTVAKSAGKLIVRGTEAIEALTAKCANATAWVGQQAIANAITSADQLAFVVKQTSSEAARWVEAVGTSIVDGTEVAWRVIVAGVDDALTAITKLIERIGAQIQEWIEYLAWLFMWDDFLAASDEAHGYIQAMMSGAGQQIARLDTLKQQFADGLRETVEDAIGKRSLADVFGIDADAVSPAFEQLAYVQEQLQELLESSELKWFQSALGEDTGIAPSAAATAQASEIERLQPLGDPRDVLVYLSTPISELLASNESLANGSPSIFDAVFDPIMAASTELIEQLDGAMFSRLEVPYLTEFLEEVILCGRTLTLARIMALMAAIPAVLTEKSSRSSTQAQSKSLITAKSTEQPSQAELDRQQYDRDTRWALWCAMSAGIANTVVIIAKSVAERRTQNEGSRKFVSFLQLMSGSLGLIRGIIFLGRSAAFPPAVRPYATINASAELTGGLCSLFFGMQGLKEVQKFETRTDWSKLELGVQLILGATVIASSGVAMDSGELGDTRSKTAFSLRCSSWVLSLSVRAFEKLDDRDSTGRLKYVTMGLAGVAAVVDVAEAIYGNVGDAQAQS